MIHGGTNCEQYDPIEVSVCIPTDNQDIVLNQLVLMEPSVQNTQSIEIDTWSSLLDEASPTQIYQYGMPSKTFASKLSADAAVFEPRAPADLNRMVSVGKEITQLDAGQCPPMFTAHTSFIEESSIEVKTKPDNSSSPVLCKENTNCRTTPDQSSPSKSSWHSFDDKSTHDTYESASIAAETLVCDIRSPQILKHEPQSATTDTARSMKEIVCDTQLRPENTCTTINSDSTDLGKLSWAHIVSRNVVENPESASKVALAPVTQVQESKKKTKPFKTGNSS